MKTLSYICWLAFVILTGCGNPTSTTTGGTTKGSTENLDDIATSLKIDYYPKNPKVPAYVAALPTVIPIKHLVGHLSAPGADSEVTNAPYLYCNLSPTDWTALRSQSVAVYPVVWSPEPDENGKRSIVMLDLRTDVIGIQFIPEATFTNDLARMEAVIRRATGQTNFSLQASLRK